MNLHPSSDQPELINNPNILYNWQNLDARGIPKVWNLQNTYQSIYETLFLATDRCYFINKEPYKILSEDWDTITFSHTKTNSEVTYTKEELKNINLYIPSFSWGKLNSLFHRLEIDQVWLYDQETKEVLLEWYTSMFANTKEWEYPADQRGINSLFYLSILLDFDKEKQKKLAKYFINNSLNTLYREEDHHYWLHKNYNAQQVWTKMWLSIKWVEESDKNFYLSVEDCKKIADQLQYTAEEFSDILYDVCLFKLGDENKASASFHRKEEFWIEDAKKYMKSDKKEDIENIQYIYENGRNNYSWIFYNIKRYDLIKANERLWVSITEQKNKVKDENKTQSAIWSEKIEEIGKDFMMKYNDWKLDVDIDAYDTTHKNNIKDNCIYLASKDNVLFITDVIEDKEILWSIKIRLGKTWSHNYDHKNNRALFLGTRKYEANIFSSPNLKTEHIHSVLSIFKLASDRIDLELYSLQLGK